jgi:toxin ParE1/3/4
VKANYKLSQEAEADLARIYRRGFEEFGEKRADQYFRDFFERFELLAEQPKMYPAADDVAKGLRKSLCGRDTIYYEIVETGIVIQFILGRQDVKRRVK